VATFLIALLSNACSIYWPYLAFATGLILIISGEVRCSTHRSRLQVEAVGTLLLGLAIGTIIPRFVG
jgi:hypothetical protein